MTLLLFCLARIQKWLVREALGSNREVRLNGLDSLGLKLDGPGGHAFALGDGQCAAGNINIRDAQTAELRHPDAGLDKHLKMGILAHTLKIGYPDD